MQVTQGAGRISFKAIALVLFCTCVELCWLQGQASSHQVGQQVTYAGDTGGRQQVVGISTALYVC